ncbi:DUF4358 domain-containing protein [Paenibacillus chitinolyticus]|uniref:DUF4358 domain-containing protein n=1 Tax=Paenibacillus chitinolyticus TaxID=79263 RepID=UPI0035DF10C0
MLNNLTDRSLKGALLILLLACLCIAAGCSGKGKSEVIPVDEIGKHIEQSVSLDNLKKGDLEKVQKLYGLEAEVVEDVILYTATSNVKADEIAVIRLKEEGKSDYVKQRLMKRIDEQTVKFKDYRPDEYALINKHVLKVKGSYVLFAVSKDARLIERAFDEALGK